MIKFISLTSMALFFMISQAVGQENSCITHDDLVIQVYEKSKTNDKEKLEFRIKTADDGQSLIYWHTGGKTGSFFAATFKSNGCAILTKKGKLRRFTFPKTAFNTGVFFEMDEFDYKL